MCQFKKPQEIENIFKNAVKCYKNESDHLFHNNNALLKPFKPLGVYCEVDYSLCSESHEVNITCNVPGCVKIFENLKFYELHYNTYHKYKCSFCKKNLPSNHLLDLHILEVHDTYFQLLAEKSPALLCYLEECNSKFKTKEERHSHCINVHNFPHDFRFEIINKTQKIKSVKEQFLPNPGNNENDLSECFKNLTFGHSCIKSFVSSKKSNVKNVKMEIKSNLDANK